MCTSFHTYHTKTHAILAFDSAECNKIISWRSISSSAQYAIITFFDFTGITTYRATKFMTSFFFWLSASRFDVIRIVVAKVKIVRQRCVIMLAIGKSAVINVFYCQSRVRFLLSQFYKIQVYRESIWLQRNDVTIDINCTKLILAYAAFNT